MTGQHSEQPTARDLMYRVNVRVRSFMQVG